MRDVPPNIGLETPEVERIALYDPKAILSALDDKQDAEWDDLPGPDAGAPPSNDSYSVEERQWRRTLRQIAEDPRGPWREVLIGSFAMASIVAVLDEVAPHFGAVTRLVRRAVVASARTNTRVRLQPICLLGPPGIGKTYYARRCASALDGLHFVEIPMNMLNDRGRVSGYSMAWRGARAGDIALGVLAPGSRHSGCIFCCDEIDKVDPRERLHDVLLSLLEPENAMRYVDEYLTAIAPLRLDHAYVIATANDLSQVPTPLIDRMLVVNVDRPAGDQLRAVVRSIYSSVVGPYGPKFCPFFDDSVYAQLEPLTPRQMRRALDLAVPIALESDRWCLGAADIATALETMLTSRPSRMGFMR